MLQGPAGREPGSPGEEPGTATERRIARVWQEVLGVERVGLDDSFFDLGGHSLLMVRAYHKLKADTEPGSPAMAFPLVKVFEYPTVSALARFIDQAAAGPAGAPSASRIRGLDRGSRRRQAQRRRSARVRK